MSGDGKTNLSVVDGGLASEPTDVQLGDILGEIVDGLANNGIQLSMESAYKSLKLVAQAKAIFAAREKRRLEEAEVEARKKAEAARRQVEMQEKAALNAAELFADELLNAATASPAPPEAIAAFVEAAGQKTVPARPQLTNTELVDSIVPAGMVTEVSQLDGLKENFSSMLPAIVFQSWQYAAAFRGWLAKYKKPVVEAVKAERQKLSAEQDADFIGALEERVTRFDDLFTMINAVIVDGWGKNPKTDMATFNFFSDVEEACNGTKFGQLRDMPQRFTAEEKKAMADEAKAREVAVKARGACQFDIMTRLINAGFSEEDSAKMASAWLRKCDGGLEASNVLTTKAINFALIGETDKAAKVALAAGLDTDVFDALVGAKKAELEESARKQAVAALANRGTQAGAMAPNAKPKSKKDKGGKNNKKNGGKEGRR